MDITVKIKKAETTGNLVIGLKSVMSAVRQGNLSDVIVSSNCPKSLIDEVSHTAKLSEIPVTMFEGDSSDLGESCRKPFHIAVLGISLKKA
ncbi:MAG: 50S ribosomal protein L30e [Candidatus Aenigmarchaeota archaeon]|nr:50S ribosomal protein L30e [Candidatus Aenigmarchaeota archaeon]